MCISFKRNKELEFIKWNNNKLLVKLQYLGDSGCHYQANKDILRETHKLLFNQIHKTK